MIDWYRHICPRPKRFYRHMNQQKADEMRRRYFSGELNQRELGEEYGLRQNSVSRILNDIVWL